MCAWRAEQTGLTKWKPIPYNRNTYTIYWYCAHFITVIIIGCYRVVSTGTISHIDITGFLLSNYAIEYNTVSTWTNESVIEFTLEIVEELSNFDSTSDNGNLNANFNFIDWICNGIFYVVWCGVVFVLTPTIIIIVLFMAFKVIRGKNR